MSAKYNSNQIVKPVTNLFQLNFNVSSFFSIAYAVVTN